MTELVVEIPGELEIGIKQLSKKDVNFVVCNALKEKLSERLMFKITDELLKKSELTDELALKWAAELKTRAAKRR